MNCILEILYPHTIEIERLPVSQFFFPDDFGTVDVMAGGVGRIFHTYKDLGPNLGSEIGFKVQAAATVIIHPAFVIPPGSVIFEHDRGFVAETRSVSLVRIGFHLTPSLGLRTKSKKTGA